MFWEARLGACCAQQWLDARDTKRTLFTARSQNCFFYPIFSLCLWQASVPLNEKPLAFFSCGAACLSSRDLNAHTAALWRSTTQAYWRLRGCLQFLEDQQTLPDVALDTIRAATENLTLLMTSAVQPLVASVADSVEAIILTMHNEDFSG